MPAFKEKLTIEQGATFDESWDWLDEEGNPVDLTGWTGKMDIRENIAAETPYMTLTTENGRIVLGEVAGRVRLLIEASATAAIAWPKAIFDLHLIDASGDYIVRFMKGSVIIDPGVTRS
jgi:hypothetical protein